MQIWLSIKPRLKCTQFGKFKKEYEDKIALAEANIGQALEARAKVQAVYDGLMGQKTELSLALKSGGSAVQDIIDKTTRIEAQAADVQKELDGVNARIKGEKAQKVALEGQIQKINSTVAQLEGDVKNLEGVLASAEQDRANKDDQIRTLKDEIAHQGDMISKLSKEKRNVGDSRQKTEEDIQAAEDKCNHLSRVKGKLEQALEREKKVKGDVEKSKRKLEGDLKLTQEAISDLERVKAELLGGVSRKEKEASALSAKIDDEATLAAKYAKQAKELMARIEELDEELNVERGNRAKAEKSRTMLKKDIEDISSRLEEAGSNTATQVELNKKREGELARLKGELEELNIAQEGTLAALRMKHNNTMSDLGEQIDSLNASKVKSEKDKSGLELDLRDA